MIDINTRGVIINKHIYGHFAEHLGRCIYGGFYVGENSPIPNTRGIRNDVIDALIRIKIPNLRWPGGCFADTYFWQDGIGERHARPAIVNHWWGEVTEDNSFGTHDFLDLCESLGTEPFITANLGSGSVKQLMDWIQYTNFDGVSPMSDLRRKNGREKPWSVKFWGLGNEAWGCGGNMTASYYANIYRQYATFMVGWSNTQHVFRIASGPNTTDFQWTETLMRDIPHFLLEGIAMHYYAVNDWQRRGDATTFSNEDYLVTVNAALRMDELIATHRRIMDKYDPKENVALVVDEWGTWYDVEPGTNPGFLFQQNTMRDAIVAALTLNIFNKHCSRIRIANIAQTINVLQALIYTQGEKLWLSPTYHVFDMYKYHQGNRLLEHELQCSRIQTGDAMVPSLSASASVNENNVTCITIANIHPTESTSIEIALSGNEFSKARIRLLTSGKITDYNSADNPNLITCPDFYDAPIIQNKFQLIIPRCSVISCMVS